MLRFNSRTRVFKADFKPLFKFSRPSKNTAKKKTLEKTFP